MRKSGHITAPLIALAAALLLASASCQSDNAISLVNQEDAIEKYISSKYADYPVTRQEGANRVTVIEGDGTVVAAPGDSIYMNIEGYVFTNSPSTRFLSDELTVELGPRDLVEGLEKGLTGVAEGEECYIFFSAKYGYYDSSVGIVPPMSALMYRVNILEIKKQ